MAESEARPQEQMAAQPAAQPAQQQAALQMEARPCPKDCGKCTLPHQIYCTAKMTFDSFSVMNVIIQHISLLSDKITILTEKVDAQSEKIAELSGRIAVIESDKTAFSAPAPVEADLFKQP